MIGPFHWQGPRWPYSPHASGGPRYAALYGPSARFPAARGSISAPRTWRRYTPRGGEPPGGEVGGKGNSTYRPPQGTEQGSVARGGPLPVVRSNGAICDALEGDGLRYL